MVYSIFWHWLYYFYSGLAFALGVALYLLQRASHPITPSIVGQEKLSR
jgi:hypothetical protein